MMSDNTSTSVAGDVPVETRGRTTLRDDDHGSEPRDIPAGDTRERHGGVSSQDWAVTGQDRPIHDTETLTGSHEHDPAGQDGDFYSGQTRNADSPSRDHDHHGFDGDDDLEHSHHHHHEHDDEEYPKNSYEGHTDPLVAFPTAPAGHSWPRTNEWDAPESRDHEGNVIEDRHDRHESSRNPEQPSAAEHLSDPNTSGKRGDSLIGKMMEKAGDVFHSGKVAEKGHDKREEKAEEKSEKRREKIDERDWAVEGHEDVGSHW